MICSGYIGGIRLTVMVIGSLFFVLAILLFLVYVSFSAVVVAIKLLIILYRGLRMCMSGKRFS